jgi:Protein of unknown function (DUF429)
MLVLGIDPAPSKKSIVFDGELFHHFDINELEEYLNKISERHSDVFISWDAPLSAALNKKNFSLSIRKIESFFYRQSKTARALNKERGIPKGISTLGFSTCPHWTISQYLFGLPILNPRLHKTSEYKLLMSQKELQLKGLQITEAHPALSMWILLKEELKDNKYFQDSWQYKGNTLKETLLRREILIDAVLKHPLTQKVLSSNIEISNDDELDAYICWLLAKHLIRKGEDVRIYGDSDNGSFLLPYDETIYKLLHKTLSKF